MEKEIIFHIGYPKTGTSFLQNLFEDKNNSNILDELSLGYSRHINKSNYLEEVKFINECSDVELSSNIDSWFKKKRCQRLLISNEAYIHLNSQGIKTLFNATKKIAQPKVIIYLKRQDLLCESSWKQWGLKHHSFDVEFKKFTTIGVMYSELLDAWAEVFGLENIIVRIHDREKLKKGIAFDFFRALGIEYKEINLPKKPVNSGFSKHALEVAYLSRDLMEDEHDNSINDLLSKYSIGEKGIYTGYDLLNNKQRKEIIDFHKEDNTYVLRKYFNNQFPELFSKFESENEEFTPPNTTFEDVVPVFMGIMLGQEERIESLEKRYNNLKNNKIVRIIRKLKLI